MHTKIEVKVSIRNLRFLPAFAAYIRTQRLEEFFRYQLKLSREINVPLLKLLDKLPEDQLLQLGMKSAAEFLEFLELNKAEEGIKLSTERWKANQLQVPNVDMYDIAAEDITLISYVRKQAFLHFIAEYSSNAEQIIELIREIDLYYLYAETDATNTYVDLLKNRIDEHSHFIEKINNTSPGIIYVFDLLEQREVYSNTKVGSLLGYTNDELHTMGANVLSKLMHPDDQETAKEYLQSLRNAKDGEILSFRYRLKDKNGDYRWMRCYETVFKRANNGIPKEIIGIALDIDREKRTAEELKRSEEELRKNEIRYKNAEALTHLGSYEWDFKTNEIKWSDELFRIYGLEPQDRLLNADEIRKYNHPKDAKAIAAAMQLALKTQQPFEFNYTIVTQDGTEKILQASGAFMYDEAGNPISLIGTAQDITERQLLLERLRQSEYLYKQAQALVSLGNWSYDLKTKQYTWSDEIFAIYELQLGSLLPTEAAVKMIHPDDYEMVMNHFDECVATSKPYNLKHRIVMPDGRIKFLHRKAEIIHDEQGQPSQLIGSTQDITEAERIQHELKENQNFIRKIADAAPSIIASYNINTGEYVFINEGLRKQLGYDPKEVLEKGIGFFLDIIHPDDMVMIASKHAKIIDEANRDINYNNVVAEFTYRMRHINGEYKWFHTFGTIFDRNPQGKVEHVLNISLDVTEQVEATRRLQEQEHFIQNLADASPTILYLYDVEQDAMIYMNREIFFVLGYDPDEIIDAGSQITQRLYHPDDWQLLPERRASEKRFQQSTSMIQYECRMKYKEGDWRWFLVREVAFKTNNEGKVTQIVGAALDIQKRKEIERQLLQNSFQLQQSNASLEEFAYVASHDLKEPLRKISTFGDRLVESNTEQLTESGKIYLKKIVDASQRMQVMINDLLSISMISGNRSFEHCSLQNILNDVLQTLEFKIEQKNAVIQADPLPEVSIVPSQFRQLFQNLLSNSLKFVRENVQPVIRITHEYIGPEQTKHYQLAKAPKYHKIEFTDNGIGFDNTYAGKIFTIFQRLHGRSEYEGTGIGLAICKKIVEHHGGVIFASGVENDGATFTIILPL